MPASPITPVERGGGEVVGEAGAARGRADGSFGGGRFGGHRHLPEAVAAARRSLAPHRSLGVRSPRRGKRILRSPLLAVWGHPPEDWIRCPARSPISPTTTCSRSAILDRWGGERTFDQLRAQNADGPRFSFIDGPVTANKSLGRAHRLGRTLKDVFQRYKALNGFHQRYQNGFDCQGLWIEVGVEQQLGLNSKREIEEYGLEPFARKCRDRWSSGRRAS